MNMIKKQAITVFSVLLISVIAQASQLYTMLPGNYILTHENSGSFVGLGCFEKLTISIKENNIYFPLNTRIQFPTAEEQVCGASANSQYADCLSVNEDSILYKVIDGSGFSKLTKKSILSYANGTLTYKHTEFTWAAPGVGNLLNGVSCTYKKLNSDLILD